MQEASLRWVLRELSDCDWLVMKAHATGYPLGYYQNYMQETLFESMRKRLISLCAGVTLSSYLAQEEPFTVGDYLDVVYEELWENVVGQKPLTPSCRIMQRHSIVLLNSKIKAMAVTRCSCWPMRPTTRIWNCSASTGRPLRRAPRWARGTAGSRPIDVAALDETGDGLLHPADEAPHAAHRADAPGGGGRKDLLPGHALFRGADDRLPKPEITASSR